MAATSAAIEHEREPQPALAKTQAPPVQQPAAAPPQTGPAQFSDRFVARAKAWYASRAGMWPTAQVNRVRKALGLSENGAIDAELVAAVATFQQRNGVHPVDGSAGRDTLRLLLGAEVPAGTKEVSDAITGKFEGGSYGTLQTYDAGIISYGKHQTTLASGGLAGLLDVYLGKAKAEKTPSETSRQIEGYLPRVRAKDATLRADKTFLGLLTAAASEPAMQAAQDQFFGDAYWKPAVGLALAYGIRSALGFATFYDTYVQGGAETVAERTRRALGGIVGATVQQKGTDGKPVAHTITEQEFLQRFNTLRESRLEAIAVADARAGDPTTAGALRGSKVRPRAFGDLATAGNLDLHPNVPGTDDLSFQYYGGTSTTVKGRTP